jgi:hypothetical protein
MHVLLNDNGEDDLLCVQELWFNPVGTARCDDKYQGKDVLGGCYGRLAVVSDVDGDGVCPECRQRAERSAVLYRSKYNGAMLGSRWT